MRLIIFDFDGVVADSEHLAMLVLAEGLSGLGLPTTADEAVRLYMGKGLADCVQAMEAQLGSPLPDGFMAAQIERVHSRVVAEAAPVQGLMPFLTEFSTSGDASPLRASSITSAVVWTRCGWRTGSSIASVGMMWSAASLIPICF